MHRGLASYIPSGDSDEGELLRRYGPIVERLARRLVARTGMTSAYDDLWSSGALGLIEAAHRFDPSRGVSFEVFAEHRVRGAMLDELRRLDHLPRRLRTQAADVSERRRQLTNSLGREPTAPELAQSLEMTIEALGEMELVAEPHVSLEFVAELSGEGTEDAVARAEAARTLARAIETLPERLRVILGLIYTEDLSYAEVADLLDISRPRVCQLHADAIAKLRAALNLAGPEG